MSDLQLPDYSDDNESWREPRIIFTGHVRGTAWPQCGDPNSIFVQIGDDGDDYRQRGLWRPGVGVGRADGRRRPEKSLTAT